MPIRIAFDNNAATASHVIILATGLADWLGIAAVDRHAFLPLYDSVTPNKWKARYNLKLAIGYPATAAHNRSGPAARKPPVRFRLSGNGKPMVKRHNDRCRRQLAESPCFAGDRCIVGNAGRRFGGPNGDPIRSTCPIRNCPGLTVCPTRPGILGAAHLST